VPTRNRIYLPVLLLLLALALGGTAGMAQPVLNELMASNTSTLADQEGAYFDWLEIRNPGATAADLTGWYLTDSKDNKKRWQFPAVTIPAGGYLIVFASGKDRRNPAAQLHTNFNLNAGGEYVALVRADGTTVASEVTYPAQEANVAYGIAGGTTGSSTAYDFLERPTPGAANSPARAIEQTVAFSRASGPFSGTVNVTLAGAGANQRIRYVVTSGTNGSTAPAPTASSTLYTGAIAVSASSVIKAAVFSESGNASGPMTAAHYLKIGASAAAFSTQLPVLVIDSLGSGPLVKDDLDHNSWLYAFTGGNSGTPVFNRTPDTRGSLAVSVRGSTSAEFPKKSFSLKFTNADGGGAEQALLDLPAYERWVLVGPWKYDLSYLNNAFVYSLSNQLGRWAPRTRFTEVYFNADGGDLTSADYAGIYVLTDRIEQGKGRVDIKDLSPSDVSGNALTGGYIIKLDSKDPEEIGWKTSHGIPENGTSSIVLVHPSASEVAPAQVDYLRTYVQAMEDALYADRATAWAQRTYLDYIDRASWVDHHLLNTFVSNPDALQRSAYFTKNRGGKLQAGPVWDFDRALGSYWDERSYEYTVWSGVGSVDFWRTGWWGLLARDPEFMQDWVDRWQSLRRADLSNSNLTRLVEALGAQIGQDAVTRDVARWPDNLSPYGNFTARLDHLKGWVTLRAQWIDDQFVREPSVVRSGTSITFTPPAGARLAYTVDGSDPRALGGEIAVNATVVSGPVTLSASANVHVRSYRAESRAVFPGSPWSAAVGADPSTPLTPRARIVNLSSRAVAASGEDALIAGVVVADTGGKRYVSRAIGPALAAFGATGTLPDPQLTVFSSSGTELFRNSAWERGPDAAELPGYFKSVGAFPLPAGSLDAALATELKAGAYTLQIASAGNRSGLALAELYELDTNGRTVNLSTRARVRADDGAIIGGFVVQGPAYKRMLLRAVGPTLAAFGLTGALRDPVLTVYSGQTVVATNDRWEAAENAAAIATATKNAGAFALGGGSEDAALLITLPPGAYTVEVKGKNNTEGVALLEIYEVP
jgi:hypothetical protein